MDEEREGGKGERRNRIGREERDEKGKGGGKGPSPQKKILAPPLILYVHYSEIESWV